MVEVELSYQADAELQGLQRPHAGQHQLLKLPAAVGYQQLGQHHILDDVGFVPHLGEAQVPGTLGFR